MTNKLTALFNMEGTKGKQSLRKTNILKMILGKNKDYVEYTDVPLRDLLRISPLMINEFKQIN